MKHHFHVILILLLPLLAVLGYAKADYPYDVTLTQINLASVDSFLHNTPDTPAADSLQTDSVAVDSTKQRILFIGDSMVGGLGPFMAKYAYANGHEFTFVTWASSTTFAWASDTLRYYIKQANPTYMMISIGGNEQSNRDTRQAEKNIQDMLAIIGDIPYIWVCTPEWKKDSPFNFAPLHVCGQKRFFDSRPLDLPRGPDKKHPNTEGYSTWMDSLAVWMGDPQKTAHPILMNPYPADAPSNQCKAFVLKPNTRMNHTHNAPAPATVGKKGAAPTPAAAKPTDTPAKATPAAEAPAAPAPAAPTPASHSTPTHVAAPAGE